MIQKQLPPSFSFVAVLTSLLLIGTNVQLSMSLTRDVARDCTNENYFATYNENVIPGFKMLDAIQAARQFILRSPELLAMFQVYFPESIQNTMGLQKATLAIKSLMELTQMNEKFKLLHRNNRNPQIKLVQLMFTKVTEEYCRWLNESADVNICDCTNIDMVELEEIHIRIVLYATLRSAFTAVNEVNDKVNSETVHYCAWINDRVFDNCNDRNNTNYNHLDTLNTVLCNRVGLRQCKPRLCPHTAEGIN